MIKTQNILFLGIILMSTSAMAQLRHEVKVQKIQNTQVTKAMKTSKRPLRSATTTKSVSMKTSSVVSGS